MSSSDETVSEALTRCFFNAYGVPCHRVPLKVDERTPDFMIELSDPVACEVKQIDPSSEDRAEMEDLKAILRGQSNERPEGRWMPNRINKVLKDVSAQLKKAADGGTATLVIVYDNTPFSGLYSDDTDVMQGMFGHLSVDVWVDEHGETQHSDTYFGGNRRFTSTTNTSVSAVGVLHGGPARREKLWLRIFHNPYAKVPLKTTLFEGLPVLHHPPQGYARNEST